VCLNDLSQARIRAYDDGTPPKAAVTTLVINVNRNLNCPQWRTGDQTVEILETVDSAAVIADVEAEDRDTQVLSFL
jgi:hypothetical protein